MAEQPTAENTKDDKKQARIKQFLSEIDGWTSPTKTSLGTDPDSMFDKLVTDYKDVLPYTLQEDGKKTNLVKMLFEQTYKGTPQFPGANYFPYSRLKEHKDAKDYVLAAALDPDLTITRDGKTRPLGEEMLKLAVEKKDHDFANKLLKAGVPLDVYLLELAVKQKDYDFAVKLLETGAPLYRDKDDHAGILAILKADKEIPAPQAQALSKAIQTKIGDTPIMHGLLSRPGMHDTEFAAIYFGREPDRLPKPLLRRAEELALVEGYNDAKQNSRPFTGGTIDESLKTGQSLTFIDGFLLDDKDKTNEGKPLIHMATGAEEVTSRAVHSPIGFSTYKDVKQFLAQVREENTADNAAKTPLGKALLQTQNAYQGEMERQLARTDECEDPKKLVDERLQKIIAEKRKQYDLSDVHMKQLLDYQDSYRIPSAEDRKKSEPAPSPTPEKKEIGMGDSLLRAAMASVLSVDHAQIEQQAKLPAKAKSTIAYSPVA